MTRRKPTTRKSRQQILKDVIFQKYDPPEAAANRNPLLGEPKTRKCRQKILKDVIFQKYDPPEAAANRNPQPGGARDQRFQKIFKKA